MPCFDHDGSLSPLAVTVLTAMLDAPLSAEEVASAMGRPPDTGSRFARALVNAGFIEDIGERFDLTDLGREKLHAQSN